jgi:hypothetical protein
MRGSERWTDVTASPESSTKDAPREVAVIVLQTDIMVAFSIEGSMD